MSGRILLLGGTGLLGQAIASALRRRGRPFDAPSREELDLGAIGDTALEAAITSRRPPAILNAASFSDVAAAERPENHQAVLRLNKDLPARLARLSSRLGIPLVHLSTDYVFDGTARRPCREDDPAAPLQTYGLSKRQGEVEALAAHPGAIVARTSTLFGPGARQRPHYIEAILRQAREGKSLQVVEHPIASPTYAPDLAGGLLALLDRGATGLFHVVNSGWCSRLELARAAVEIAGLAVRVEARPDDGTVEPPRRPAFSALDTSRFASTAGAPLRPWREALAEYLAPGARAGAGGASSS